MMFKRDKSMFEQLIRRDVGQSPNIVSVSLTVGNYALLRPAKSAARSSSTCL